MKHRVAGGRGLVWGACGALLALSAACGVAPDSTIALTGVWMGVEEETEQGWELVVIDEPPEEIWGTARSSSGTERDVSWGPAVQLSGHREAPVALVWEIGALRYRFEVDTPPSEDDPDQMGGTLTRESPFGPRTSRSLALMRVRQASPD